MGNKKYHATRADSPIPTIAKPVNISTITVK
jgi:hypothetical protein